MIQHIKIKGFWDRYNIDWKPYPDVNILIGVNGSGKSTLLKLIDLSLSKTMDASVELARFIHDGYSIEIEGNDININTKEGETYCANDCNYYFISTFDEIVKEERALEGKLSPLAASLDATIFNTKIMSLNSYRLKATENPEMGIYISNRLQQWIEIVNDFFAETNKTFEIQGDVFFRQSDGTKITLEQLSAGEKQLLIILTKVLVQDEKPFVLLMDEPEISLDIDWQGKLIRSIRKINPNCQLFIATHSPGIFGDGWNDRLIFMEELLKK